MLSCNFCSSPSTLLSSPPAIVELLDRFTFFELALYLELPLVFVLSVELELERDDSEIERVCPSGVSFFKASLSSSTFLAS